jgi:hypothetical protein
LDLRLRREISWHFVVADITGPIIGSDFLSFYNLLVDIRHRRLIDNITNLTVLGASLGTNGGHVKILAGSSRYQAVLQVLQVFPGNPGILQSIIFAPHLDHL